MKVCMLTIVLMSAVCFVAKAQTIEEILLDMSKAYQTTDFALDFEVNMYTDSLNKERKQQYSTGKLIKTGSFYYTAMEGLEQVYNKEGLISINNKFGIVKFKKGSSFQQPDPITIEQVKAFNINADTVMLMSSPEEFYHIRFVMTGHDIEVVDMYINRTTHLLQKLAYTYSDPSIFGDINVYRLEVDYREIPLWKNKQFKTSEYLSKTDGTYTYRKDTSYKVYELSESKTAQP